MPRHISRGRLTTGLSRTLAVSLSVLGLFLSKAKAQTQLQIEFIDLKCYGITGDPLNLQLQLDHLNPLLQQMGLPSETVTVLDPRQLCVPVAKNNLVPPQPSLDIIKYIDLKCYAIQGDPLGLQLRLDHLNPLLQRMGLPPETVTLQNPEKLCVPVAKNRMQIPPPALNILQYLDLKCYTIQGDPLNLPLVLSHLNPLFQLGTPPLEQVQVLDPQDLCVPVMKNQQPPPRDVAPIVANIDLKCYGIQGEPFNLLELEHLDPVLQTLPPEQIFTLQPQQLCVPVKKSLPGGAIR